MNAYQNPNGGWNVSPQQYQAYKNRKAQKYRAKHGIGNGRIKPSLFGRILTAPFRLLWLLIKIGFVVGVLAFVVVVFASVLQGAL